MSFRPASIPRTGLSCRLVVASSARRLLSGSLRGTNELDIRRPPRSSPALTISSTSPRAHSTPPSRLPPRARLPKPQHRLFSSSPLSTSASRRPPAPPSDLQVEAVHVPASPSSSNSPPSLHLKISCPSFGIPSGSLYSARWLRDSDRSTASIQSTGQKWHRSSDVDPHIELKSPTSWEIFFPPSPGVTPEIGNTEMVVTEPTLRIEWKGTGMRSSAATSSSPPSDTSSCLPLSLLAAASPLTASTHTSSPLQSPLPPTIPWTLPTLLSSPSLSLPYADFLSSPATLHVALTQLRSYGIFFLHGVPTNDTSDKGCELRVLAEQIGEVRRTFYGETWDVRALGRKSENVAYTNVDLGLHMDLLYFENPPGLQFLHSLRSLAKGGSSYFVDSYTAALSLRSHSPQTYLYLTQTPIPYHYNSPTQAMYHSHPLIQLAPPPPDRPDLPPLEREIAHVNYSPPFQAPLSAALPGGPGKLMDALRMFEAELEKDGMRYEVRMEKGECVVFDNRRVLHARREFWEAEGTEGEERWLKGCYVDGDAGWGRWRVGERERLRREDDEGEGK